MRPFHSTLSLLALPLLAASILAQGPPIFTADYYMANPESYLNKEVTLTVAFVQPRNERRTDGLRQLEAYTYNQNRPGGWISLLCANASSLMQLCGTQLQDNSAYGVHVTFIHGTFKAEDKEAGRYYIVVKQ